MKFETFSDVFERNRAAHYDALMRVRVGHDLIRLGILVEITGQRRSRAYAFDRCL